MTSPLEPRRFTSLEEEKKALKQWYKRQLKSFRAAATDSEQRAMGVFKLSLVYHRALQELEDREKSVEQKQDGS